MSLSGFIKRNIYWANDFLHGQKVGKHYKDLKNVLADKEAGSAIQQKHLHELLEHATENSAFYRPYRGLAFENFPVINRTILNENHADVCVPIEKVPEQEGNEIHIQTTSGSTGTPFKIPQDTRKRNRRIAELKYFNATVGFKSHEMLGQCRMWYKYRFSLKGKTFKENIVPINVSKMDDETIQNLLRTVKKYRCVALRAYASWYDAIVKYLEEGKGDPKDLETLKVCISSSEALNEDTRIKMKEIAGVPIVEAYANEEGGMLAQQLIGDNNYYLNHSGYVFEFLKMDSDEPAQPGELSRIVITDLFNYAFPLIRYDTGDTAIYEKQNEKSNGWPYISKLYGRMLDLVYSTIGEPVHPMNFFWIARDFPGVIQWQFVQTGEKDYAIRLRATQESNPEKPVQDLKKLLGADANIVVEYVDEISTLASGKRKPVICEWKK